MNIFLTRPIEGDWSPGVLTLYAEKPPARLIVEYRMTAARPNDEHGLVEVREPFWGEDLCKKQIVQASCQQRWCTRICLPHGMRGASRLLKRSTRTILLDFSQRRGLTLHGEVGADVMSPHAAVGAPDIVVGAFARDLHLHHGAGILRAERHGGHRLRSSNG